MNRGGWRWREGGKWERVWSTGYRRFNLRAMRPVTIWDSGDTGEVIDYHGTDLSPPSSLLFFFLLFLSLFFCFPSPYPSPASSTLSSLACSFSLFLFLSFLASLPQVFRTDAKIYTWRLLRRCTLVWMEAGHSTAPRTVKRKIYGFQKNSLRSILEGGGESGEGERRTRSSREKNTQGTQYRGEEMDARCGERERE